MGDDYTEDTLSDKENNVETCDPGCGQGIRYQCKDGYTYDETSKSCKPATCHIEEAPNPDPDNCKYDLKLNTYDAIPSGGVDKPAGTSVRVWAYRQDPSVISDIKGINGQFQVSSYSGYKDFTCESGETYSIYATCGEGCAEFPLTEEKDKNCWDCYTCPASNNRFQCTLSEKSGYKWDYSTSTCKEECTPACSDSSYTLGLSSCSANTTSTTYTLSRTADTCGNANACGKCTKSCNSGYKLENGTCKKSCNITVTCAERTPIGERSDIDNTTESSAIRINYSCTISNYNDVKSYLDKLNLVIKTKLACVQGDSNIVKTGQYYEMTRIPFSNATSSNFSGIYKLYNPLYKNKLDCGSNHTSYEGTTYELDNKTGCTLNSSSSTIKTCASYSLKTESEANCGTGYKFQQDTTHKTDDNGDKCGTCVKDNSSCYGTANVYLAYYRDWPSDSSVLKGGNTIQLGFKSADKTSYLKYSGNNVESTSVTLDDNHYYYSTVEPTNDATKCYYKVITKEKYESTTGLSLRTSGRPNSIDWIASFYGSIWQAWPSSNVVNCKGDWVAVMACFTKHGDSLNQYSYCNQYDGNYGSCYSDANGGTQLPSEIAGGYSDQKSCCVKFGTR